MLRRQSLIGDKSLLTLVVRLQLVRLSDILEQINEIFRANSHGRSTKVVVLTVQRCLLTARTLLQQMKTHLLARR